MKRFTILGLTLVLAACGGPDADMDDGVPAQAAEPNDRSWDDEQGPGDTIATVTGLAGPEAVRYDADEDVWFIANFGEDAPEARDTNGFIARVNAGDGTLASLRWAVGTEAYPLHQPRGMYVTGDTLWVADVDGMHGFHKSTGQQIIFRDLSQFEPGFINDIAAGPDGALYLTDTGRSAVYRIDGENITEAMADSSLFSPNGITFDRRSNRLVLVPWQPGGSVRYWTPGQGLGEVYGGVTPGRLDGVEIVGDRMLVASQTDSTISVFGPEGMVRVIHVSGRPADIGIDTRRNRVAVPYIDLDRVDIWQLPRN